MFRHYLKVSFRNLWKYKSQTLVSVVGLAVGFACFAIATLWIRYEMTYDGFHKNADRLYRVSARDESNGDIDGIKTVFRVPLPEYLKKTFPEIKNATQLAEIMNYEPEEIEIDNVEVPVKVLHADPFVFDVFDIRTVEGNDEFKIQWSDKVAITQEKARQLFGNENPVGKTVKYSSGYYKTIGAVINGFPKHSNYTFDILTITDGNYGNAIVELVPGVDVKAFEKKLYEHKATVTWRRIDGQNIDENVEKMRLSPLTSIHYTDPYIKRSVKFQHIIIFALSGSLLILCTLFNYLALFLSRFRIRMKELALRVVCGASNRSLFMLLSVEFLMSLTVSLVLGALIIYVIMPYFMQMSEVHIELSFIYIELLIYIVAVILASLLVFLLTLTIFRRRTLNVAVGRGNRKMFRKASIVVQLTVSIVFAFCTTIILKQMYHLHNTADLGFTFKDRGSISSEWGGFEASVFDNILKQIPEVTESVVCWSLDDNSLYSTGVYYDWIGRPQNVEPISTLVKLVSEKSAKFYEYKLIVGEMLNETDDDKIDDRYVLLNESAAKVFGWKDPVGQTFETSYVHPNTQKIVKIKYTVKGVIKNVYSDSPTIPVKPVIYRSEGKIRARSVLFKYKEGTWKTCCEKITRLVKEKYPEVVVNSWMSEYKLRQQANIQILNMEQEYDKLLKSENVLLKILTLISLVCMFVCVFGFVSMVSLTCEERRKEIAIRKINGATIKDILDIFFKEYVTLLIIGTVIAFPTGHYIMKQWLEQYMIQTGMDVWIHLSILLTLMITIILCVGGKVYRTSRENPAEAIKS
jgi:hypothetical protein